MDVLKLPVGTLRLTLCKAEGTAEVAPLCHLEQHTAGALAVLRADAAGIRTILVFTRLNFRLAAPPCVYVELSAPNEGGKAAALGTGFLKINFVAPAHMSGFDTPHADGADAVGMAHNLSFWAGKDSFCPLHLSSSSCSTRAMRPLAMSSGIST
ncbi:hypothetical protein SDC9_130377 [bioreactor metagenome]|uniref:Uncharacterized protein n=1 Tax=bioreactor metagenome TaxID=1076179 RepID=A0A645D2H5_9ZZZZ